MINDWKASIESLFFFQFLVFPTSYTTLQNLKFCQWVRSVAAVHASIFMISSRMLDLSAM